MPTLSEIIFAIREHRLADTDAWRGRIVTWVAAVIAGLAIVVFSRLTDRAIALFFAMHQLYWWCPLIATPLGGIFIVWMTRTWFSGAAGSGIPQTIAALSDGLSAHQQSRLLSVKIAVGKVLLGIGAIAVGFSTGKEGPSVQVGASVMHAFRKLLPTNFTIHPKQLILAGGAAGISAAFNTPLAGVVFAIEELGRSFEHRTNGVVITAIILAGVVAVSIQGDYSYFGVITVDEVTTAIILPVILCGCVCGVLGGVFSRILIAGARHTDGGFGRLRSMHPLGWAGFCGLVVAVLGLLSHGAAHGSGYNFTREMLHGTITETWYYAPVKYLATIFSYLSGVPGGIFAPALAIGAGIGNDLIHLFGHPALATTIYVLCMVGFLAAVTQSPITSFIIVMEMVDNHGLVISLMSVALVASYLSRLFSPALYPTLAEIQLTQLKSSD